MSTVNTEESKGPNDPNNETPNKENGEKPQDAGKKEPKDKESKSSASKDKPGQESRQDATYFLFTDMSGHTEFVNLDQKKSLHGKKNKNYPLTGFPKHRIPNYFRFVSPEWEVCPNPHISDQSEASEDKSNQFIFRSDQAQKLSEEEIAKLKETYKGQGEKIIEELVTNSATFGQRTEFSKEKYLNKKKKKYLPIYLVQPASLSEVSKVVIEQYKVKKCHLREDTLALFKHFLSVTSDSSVFLAEKSGGLILASILNSFDEEDTESTGKIYLSELETTTYNYHNLEVLKVLGLKKKANKFVERVSNLRLISLEKERFTFSHFALLSDVSYVDAIRMAQGNFRPGCKLVLYSHTTEELNEAANYLIDSKRFVSTAIYDSFMRKLQVLPGRTHPDMNMNPSGGFLLVSYYVETESN